MAEPRLDETTNARATLIRLGCLSCALLLSACGSGGANPPSPRAAKLVPAPWSEIARTGDPTTLVINTDQDTADRSHPCFIHYTTRVMAQTSSRISIQLRAPDRAAQPVRCPAKAVRGPFLVKVRLEERYRGQGLCDPVTGRVHSLTPRRKLS